MDEHIKVAGPTVDFQGELIDDNLNSLSWWTGKHNKYASREAVDLLNLEYGFMAHDSVASLRDGSQAGLKRWLKGRVYVRLPGGLLAEIGTHCDFPARYCVAAFQTRIPSTRSIARVTPTPSVLMYLLTSATLASTK